MSGSDKRVIAAAVVAACTAIAAASADRAPRVLFNTTASAPIGFYLVSPGRYALGDLVAITPPAPLAAWMARRGYLPANVPLLKIVAAARGQHVCGRAGGLYVDGRLLARVKHRDRLGRPLPIYRGCGRMGAGELLLVNARAPDSLDGRYFGPLPAQGVVGRVRPLWTWTARR